MHDKKQKAKAEMLKKLSSMMGDERHSGLGDGLKSKKMEKVTVMAPDKASLAKGLSKAQEIIKRKTGEDYATPDEHMDAALADHEFEGDKCPYCDDGCGVCEGDDEDDSY